MSIDDLTKEKTMKEIIGQLAGSASLCWSPTPTGVFDSEQASKFVEEAQTQLLALVRDAKPTRPELYWASGGTFEDGFNTSADQYEVNLIKLFKEKK